VVPRSSAGDPKGSDVTVEIFLAFCLVQLLAALSPGPAVLLVSSQAMARGFGAGIGASAGILAGNTVYFCLSVTGIGVVIATSALLFTIIKWAGAAYLIWTGIQTWRRAREVANHGPADPVQVSRDAFLQGLVKQLANPKSVLFFGALLPQFITPGETRLEHYAALLAAMHVIELPILAAYAGLGARGGAFVRGPVGLLWRERAAGTAQIAVGGVLATLRRTA
jgi:homoserine/homoserine lactone efflux protein